MKGRACLFLGICALLAAGSSSALGQSNPSNEQSSSVKRKPVETTEDSGQIGAAVKLSTYGVGGEVAVSVRHRTNVRAGFNAISYSRGFDKDGIHYNGQVDLKTFEAHYDIFPWAKNFRVSGGVLVYATDPITGTASVPGNQSFTLGGVTYYSDPTNPARSAGKIVFNRAAPTVTFGFGNLAGTRASTSACRWSLAVPFTDRRRLRWRWAEAFAMLRAVTAGAPHRIRSFRAT
jgi:hypothetical protein